MPNIKVIERSDRRSAVYYRNIKSKSSKYKGVYFKKDAKKRKWMVKVSLNKTVFHIHTFESEEEAARCYDLTVTKFLSNTYINEEAFPELSSVVLPKSILDKIDKRIEAIKEKINATAPTNSIFRKLINS